MFKASSKVQCVQVIVFIYKLLSQIIWVDGNDRGDNQEQPCTVIKKNDMENKEKDSKECLSWEWCLRLSSIKKIPQVHVQLTLTASKLAMARWISQSLPARQSWEYFAFSPVWVQTWRTKMRCPSGLTEIYQNNHIQSGRKSLPVALLPLVGRQAAKLMWRMAEFVMLLVLRELLVFLMKLVPTVDQASRLHD